MLQVEANKNFTLQETLNDNLESEEIVEPQKLFGYVVDGLYVETGRVKRNQNLSDILSNHNVEPLKIGELAKASRKVFDVRKIRTNTPFTLICNKDSLHTARVLFYEPNPIDYVAFYLEDSIRIEMHQREVEIVQKSAAGTIRSGSSLAETMTELGISPQLTNNMVDVYAWQIEFEHIYPGDQFKVIYEEKFVDGNSVGIGNILGASFIHENKEYFAVHFDQGNGISFFDEKGSSLQRTLLKYPIEFTRISSRYSGRRFHPVQKRYKAHLGTDFAAPTGTPIRTVGDGVVLEAKYTSGNGNYVKVKHNGTYTTQYLHMSRIASGMRPGVKVKSGQTIGFVGSTGLANGPHLCFRFWKNGVQVDALKVEIPPAEPISDNNKVQYERVMHSVLDRLSRIEIPSPEVLAGGF